MDDLVRSATKESPLLLSIPISELGSSSSNGIVSPQKKKKGQRQLLLLQLPAGCPPLVSPCQHNAAVVQYFVGRDHAALIVNDQSYFVHRVETSNTLMIFPPSPKDDRRPSKRTKIMLTTTLENNNNIPTVSSGLCCSLQLEPSCTAVVVPVHRLGGGSVSSSFLELRRKYLNVSEVLAALPVWDPFDNNEKTNHHQGNNETKPPPLLLYDLSIALQASVSELRDFLDNVLDRAMAFQNDDNDNDDDDRYALMTEQVQQICSTAIVATLAEDNEYSTSTENMMEESEPPVTTLISKLVEKAMERIIPTETFPNMASAMRHVVKKSFATVVSNSSNAPDDHVILDWAKVASWVARQLLLAQNREPWPDEDFMTTWQGEMPGIHYQVHRDMLRGVAVLVEGSWCHVPVDGIWTPAELFQVLFEVQEKWSRTELQPYLDRLCQADASIVSAEQLLVRFTAPVQAQKDGLDVTLYQRKGK